jgi:hypothetical protein
MTDVHLVNALAILYGEEPVIEMEKQPVEIELPDWNPATPPSSPQTVASEGYDPATDGEFSDTESDDGEDDDPEIYRATKESFCSVLPEPKDSVWDWLDEYHPEWRGKIAVKHSWSRNCLVLVIPTEIYVDLIISKMRHKLEQEIYARFGEVPECVERFAA